MKTANALDTTGSVLTELEMDSDHMFSQDELLIVSKLTSSKDKKHLSWLVKNFRQFYQSFFPSRKAKKKDILAARNIFHGDSILW